jgi:ABC-type glycerol-3-phosphate transport system permease component
MNDDAPAMPNRLPLIAKMLLTLLMIGLGLAYLTPFTLMALGSLRESIAFIPDLKYMLSELSFANFAYIISRNQFPRWFLNSVIFAVIPVITQSIFCTLIGYVLARRDFFGKNVFFMVMLAITQAATAPIARPIKILVGSMSGQFSIYGECVLYMTPVILLSDNSAEFTFKNRCELIHDSIYLLVLKGFSCVFKDKTHRTGLLPGTEFVLIIKYIKQIDLFQQFLSCFGS